MRHVLGYVQKYPRTVRHYRRRDPEIPQAALPPGRRQRVQPPGPGAQEAAAAGGEEGDED